MTDCVFAAQGARPNVLFCAHGASAMRLVLFSPPPAKSGREKQGAQLRMEGKRTIVALASHPTDATLAFLLQGEACWQRGL